jgi:CRP-like cAMP-binding protein
MANLIGTATESAIRLISEFKSDRLIEVEGRRIKILDHQKLTRLGHVIL